MRRAIVFTTVAALASTSGCGPENTHASLMSAMISCQENICTIVESIHTADDAQAAEPRIASEAKAFLEYSNRFLLLGLPDAAKAQELKEQFGDREQKLADRLRQAGSKLSQGDQSAMLALAVALRDFSRAQKDFSQKVFGIQVARAQGKPDAPADSASIQQHEQLFHSIAVHITKITGLVAAMTDGEAVKRQSAAVENEIAAIQSDVQKYRALPALSDVKQQILLDPAKQRFKDAYKQYNQAADEAKQRPGVSGPLLTLDVHLSQALHYLSGGTMPPGGIKQTPGRLTPVPGGVTRTPSGVTPTPGRTTPTADGSIPPTERPESPAARKAREAMEAARARIEAARARMPASPPASQPPFGQPPQRP